MAASTAAASAAASLADLERRAGDASKASPEAASLLAELRAHVARLEAAARDEDPRLSFSTPEFKEAQRAFTEGFKKNFGRPVEWALVQDHAWSTPCLRKLDEPVDVDGKPWAGDKGGK